MESLNFLSSFAASALASFAALNLRERCWFILARGATPERRLLLRLLISFYHRLPRIKASLVESLIPRLGCRQRWRQRFVLPSFQAHPLHSCERFHSCQGKSCLWRGWNRMNELVPNSGIFASETVLLQSGYRSLEEIIIVSEMFPGT